MSATIASLAASAGFAALISSFDARVRAQAGAPASATEVIRGRVRVSSGARDGIRVVARREIDSTTRALGDVFAPPSTLRVESATDSRGVFRIRVPRGARWVVRAYDETRALASPIVRGAAASSLISLPMRPASRIRLAGDRVQRWTLWAYDRKRRDFFALDEGVCDARLRELPALPPGLYRLRRLTAAQQGRDVLKLALAPGEARVVADDLLAAATLELTLAGYDGPATLIAPSSLAFPMLDGRATRERPVVFTRGRCRVDVPGLGLASAMLLRRPGLPEHGFWLRAVQPKRSVALTLDASRATTLSIDSPIAGHAHVLWDRFGFGRRVFELKRGPQVLRGVARAEGIVLFRGVDDAGVAIRDCVRLDPAGETKARFTRSAAAKLLVRVLHENAEVVREARLRLWPERLPRARGAEALFPTLQVITRRDGRGEFTALPAGRWKLRVDAGRFTSSEEIVELAPGDVARRRVVLQLGKALRGFVVDARGKAAPDAFVQLSDPLGSARVGARFAPTAPDGSFQFFGLPEGRFRIEASRAGGAYRELARSIGKPGEDLRLILRSEDPQPHKR